MTRYSVTDVDPETLAFRDGYELHVGFEAKNWRKFQEAGGYERLKEKYHPIDSNILWGGNEPCAIILAIFIEESQWDDFRNSQLFEDIAGYSENKELICCGQ